MARMTKSLMVFILAMFICSCGGGGGGDDGSGGNGDGGGSPTPGVSAGTSLSAEDATTTAAAISAAAGGVTQSFDNSTPAAMVTAEKALTNLKDTGSFSGTATGSGGGTCVLTGSGASELNTNPMTFSASGTMVCNSFVTTVSTSGGNAQVTLDGTIASSFSGTITQDYATLDISFTMTVSDLSVGIGSVSYTGVNGTYSLTISGANGLYVFAESGTLGNQSVSRTYTVDYTSYYTTRVSIYDNLDDDFFMYADPSRYLGTYTSVDPSTNTCPVNATAYITAMTRNMLYFDIRGMAESASGDIASLYDMYFYTGVAATFYCTFGVSSANIVGSTYDIFTMICYDNNTNAGLCSAGWSADSLYNMTNVAIKTFSNAGGKQEAIDNALEVMDEYNKVR